MLKRTILSLALLCSASVAQATLISHTDITASTTLAQSTQSEDFSIDQIADGITSDAAPYNGFASLLGVKTGVIDLQLSKAFDLSSFVLWNDINVNVEGITSFQLSFFDSVNSLISTTGIFNIPLQNITVGQTFNFASTVIGVSKVELNVLSSNGSYITGIEIREVSFHGKATATDVPDSGSSLVILTLGLVSLVGFRRFKK